MGWSKEDREYDRMQEGFYVTRIEKRIKKLEAENARLREALKRIAEASMPHEEPVSLAIARAALEGKE